MLSKLALSSPIILLLVYMVWSNIREVLRAPKIAKARENYERAKENLLRYEDYLEKNDGYEIMIDRSQHEVLRKRYSRAFVVLVESDSQAKSKSELMEAVNKLEPDDADRIMKLLCR